MKKKVFETTLADCGERLDQFLFHAQQKKASSSSREEVLLSKGEIRKLIAGGAVYWNRKRVRIVSKPVIYPLRVELYWDARRFNPSCSQGLTWEMKETDILYHEHGILVVNKPVGLPTQATLDDARSYLFRSVQEFLKLPYLGLHHRLDRDTSGVILFTTQREMNAGVAKLFQCHQIQKTYLALAWNPRSLSVPQRWTVQNYLGKKSHFGKKTRFGSVTSGGDGAHTDFYLEQTLGDALLVRAQPKTGRTHQIRVHLAEQGLPLVGDSLYGYEGPQKPYFFLHALELRWIHPFLQKPIQVRAPLPGHWPEEVRNRNVAFQAIL